MNDPRFEVYPRKRGLPPPADAEVLSGDFGWRFRDANGRITLIGGEGFTRREDAHRAVHGAVEDVLTLAAAPLPLMSDVLERLQVVDIE